jgi:hypothetical protein
LLPPLPSSITIKATLGVKILLLPTSGVLKVCVARVVTLSPVNKPLTVGSPEDKVLPLNVRVSLWAVTVSVARVISPIASTRVTW